MYRYFCYTGRLACSSEAIATVRWGSYTDAPHLGGVLLGESYLEAEAVDPFLGRALEGELYWSSRWSGATHLDHDLGLASSY